MAKNGILALVMVSVCHIFVNVDAFTASPWYGAHATFYGGSDASGTMAGACGYGNTYTTGYGVATTALSTALFNNGASCGQCYRIVCDNTLDPQFCIKGKSITVTASDFCPPNWAEPSDNGGWCNPPRPHFDMSQPAWLNIGIYVGGIVPVLYQRVPCKRHGGMRFTINGNPWFNLVLITHVGAAGSIKAISIKGSNTNWIPMSINWGVNWESSTYLIGQVLSFVITASDGEVVQCLNIAPSNWGFGQTFSDKDCQFHR
ncbi:expansin-A1-like [Rhododendron vialii]|uniref:expansin-A1-like n=1 Tax=Rhododendron vialii TaxID=182163 RepID=UPI00265E941E|nr:expansin-A1-like [Rhododendron vialii]